MGEKPDLDQPIWKLQADEPALERSPVLVRVIGAPVACQTGIKDTWREVAAWAARQLQTRFGDAVEVVYFDLDEKLKTAIKRRLSWLDDRRSGRF